MSTRWKLIIILFAALFGIILLFSGFIYYNLIEYSYGDFHARLHLRAVTMAKIELGSNNQTTELLDFKNDYLESLANEKHYVVKTDTLNAKSLSTKLQIPESFISETLESGDNYYKLGNTFFNAIKYNTSGKNYLIIISAENYFHTHHEAYLRQLMIATIIFSILFIFFLSYWLSKRILKPLNEITSKVNEIGSENLHLRIPEENRSEELSILTKAFNIMLDRLETAFEAQKNFVSNASHELRTPLTAIIAEADLSLSRNRSGESYQDTLGIILNEAEKLNNKVQALLFLAQTGFKKSKPEFTTLRIDEVLLESKKTFNKIDPNNNLHLDFSNLPEQAQKLTINGNKQLLILAITNIMGNGLKYSKNKPVEVKLSWKGKNLIISIIDQGIGIPENDLPFIYDPYFRASNTLEYEGYGIGLPLARNIIRLHRGELKITSKRNEGVICEIKIPLASN